MATRRLSSNNQGFTLIELVAAIAIILVVTAVLVPAVQRVRETANRTATVNFLSQLTAVMQDFHRVNGQFPDTWVKVLEIGKAPADGAVSGFQLIPKKLTAHLLVVRAEPLPGVTGHDTLLLEIGPTAAATQLQSTPAAGADDARDRMLQRMFHFVMRESAALLYLLPPSDQTEFFASVAPFINEAGDSPDVRAALASLSNEGVFSLESFFAKGHEVGLADASLRQRFASIVDGIRAILGIGTFHEQLSQGGVLLSNGWTINGKLAEVMYSFGALEELTSGFLASDRARKAGLVADQIERELVQLLEHAAAADRRGDSVQKERWLKQYIALLVKVEGLLLTNLEVEALIAIARAL